MENTADKIKVVLLQKELETVRKEAAIYGAWVSILLDAIAGPGGAPLAPELTNEHINRFAETARKARGH